MNVDRAKFIEEYSKKDSESLAVQLWNEKAITKNWKSRCSRLQNRVDEFMTTRIMADFLNKKNENMGRVLKEYGLMPKRLVVTYQVNDCSGCGYMGGDEEECYDCEPDKIERVGTFSFYTFDVDEDGGLTGICSDFSDESLDVLEIRDMDSGVLLWKYKDNNIENSDESQGK